MPLGMEVGLGPGDFVLDGDPASPPKGAQPPISGHVYCGQTAGWIKMPLGTEVDLSPGHNQRMLSSFANNFTICVAQFQSTRPLCS